MCTEGPDAHFSTRVQGRGLVLGHRHFAQILAWVRLKKGCVHISAQWGTVLRHRVCERCLNFPRATKELGHVCRHAGYLIHWCQIQLLTRIAERRFLTGLPRGYFFWGEGAAIHTQATIKPCRLPLRETESLVRLKHKLIQKIVPFWKTFVPNKMSTIFKWGLYNNF